MRGLINGAQALRSTGVEVEIEEVVRSSVGRKPEVAIVLRRDGAVVGRSRIEGLSGDPTSEATDSRHVDFRGFVWQRAGVVVLAGYPRAVVIDLADGKTRKVIELAFVDKSSLDLLDLVPATNQRFLAVASSKRVVVLDDRLRIHGSYEPDGFLAEVERVTIDGVSLREYNVDEPECPIVSRMIRFA